MKPNPARLILFLIILLALLSLSACVTLKDPESAQENRADIVALLTESDPVEQSFYSRRSQLNSVHLYLSIAESGSEEQPAVLFELFRQPDGGDVLYSQSIDFSDIENQFPVTVSFPPQDDLPGQNYAIRLTVNSGSIRVYGSHHDNYTQGELHSGQLSQPGDLSFRLGYNYGREAMLQDISNGFRWSWLLLPLVLTLWLPGNLLLTGLLGNEKKFSQADFWQKTALSIGLSLAVIPIFFLWTTAAGLQLNQNSIYLLLVVLLIIKAWQSRERFLSLAKNSWKPSINFNGSALTILLTFLFSLGIRLAMTRDLAAPAWVDSVHHATLVRLILEQGAYPQTYQPLIPAVMASYHSGYHAVMAVFTWLSGLELEQAMLIFGQVLNALSVVLAYLFTLTLTGNRKAAVLAALICGVFTPMPAYLASWGRYTHLSGMLIFPAAYTFLVQYFPSIREAPSDPPLTTSLLVKSKVLLLAGIGTAGLFLTHYQVLAFLASLLLAQAGVWLGRSLWQSASRREILRGLGWLFATAVFTVLLSFPWWPKALESLIIPRAAYNPTTAPFSGFSWGYLTSASGTPILVLAVLGLVLAVLQLHWFATISYLWVGLLFLLANLGALGLPFSTFVNHISVEIALYLPTSAFGGYALAEGYRLVSRFTPIAFRRWLPLLAWLIAIPLSLLGAQKLLPILNPVTLLARQADLPAIQWIETQVPEDATILINPFSWGYGIYAGNDGGFWITPLAGRKTIPPPILYGLGESQQVVPQITELTRQAIELSKDPPGLHALMQANQVDYLYCGVRGGVFDPTLIQASPLFELVYGQDSVWVFRRR